MRKKSYKFSDFDEETERLFNRSMGKLDRSMEELDERLNNMGKELDRLFDDGDLDTIRTSIKVNYPRQTKKPKQPKRPNRASNRLSTKFWIVSELDGAIEPLMKSLKLDTLPTIHKPNLWVRAGCHIFNKPPYIVRIGNLKIDTSGIESMLRYDIPDNFFDSWTEEERAFMLKILHGLVKLDMAKDYHHRALALLEK